MNFDIFISYKRKSIATANNLYYRLTQKGYSVFFDLEEMRHNNFDEQIYRQISNAKDFVVILEEGSLDACKNGIYKEDWFCKEIIYAIQKTKNIIPVLIDNYQMPLQNSLPKEMRDLSLKNAPEFSFSYMDSFVKTLIDKYLTAIPASVNGNSSVFKFYSKEACQVFADGKMVGTLEGMDDTAFYYCVQRKGEYRFRCINVFSQECTIIQKTIGADEEQIVDIEWPERLKLEMCSNTSVRGEKYTVKLEELSFDMIRVEGGGAKDFDKNDTDGNEYSTHQVLFSTFYVGETVVTQDLWQYVMGYNKSKFKKLSTKKILSIPSSSLFSQFLTLSKIVVNKDIELDCAYPIDTISHYEAKSFVNRLSKITGFKFSLPTEKEWECAARGGKISKDFKYPGSNDVDEVAWHKSNSEGQTHPVKQKLPNELGIYDMSGNVYEWTDSKPDSMPMGEMYILKGGGWCYEEANCEITKRLIFHKDKKTSGFGMRLVLHMTE